MKDNEFYIGWMDHAPQGFTKTIRRTVLILGPLFAVIAVILATGQKPFGTGNFELGTLTKVKGVYFSRPAPCLKMANGNDILTMPLVGYGKFGAEGIVGEIEKEKGISLDKKEVTLNAILLYNDGKTVLQIDPADSPLAAVSASAAPPMRTVVQDLGDATIDGEIVDLKCYFGVMKPGEGKPHRDCAARCIAGGMAPMLLVRNQRGEANYYLMVGPNGERLNDSVKGFAGEQVSVQARRVQMDDWVILYVDGQPKRLSYLQMKYGEGVITCGR